MFLHKYKFGFLLVIVIFLLSSCSQTAKEIRAAAVPNEETSKQIERFNQLGEAVYNNTLQGKIPEARKQIILMGDLIPSMRLEGITTLMGVSALADILLEANKVFNAAQIKPEQILLASTRIRLMADALAHPNTPLWLQYNKVIQEDLRVMEQAIKQKQINDVKKSFSDLQSHYETIRPALQVSLLEAEIAKIDSVFQYMHNELSNPSIRYADLSRGLKTLNEQWDNLFQLKSETAAYLPFIESNDPLLSWMLWIGSFIILILAFVAWRMRQAREDIITIKR